ncbi:MAG: DUF1540 domain-containing protein [Cellulosilyticaceae bacterium]
MSANQCIKCTIKQCKYHDFKDDHCTLNQITVGTHELNPTQVECTDCKSFVLE